MNWPPLNCDWWCVLWRTYWKKMWLIGLLVSFDHLILFFMAYLQLWWQLNEHDSKFQMYQFRMVEKDFQPLELFETNFHQVERWKILKKSCVYIKKSKIMFFFVFLTIWFEVLGLRIWHSQCYKSLRIVSSQILKESQQFLCIHQPWTILVFCTFVVVKVFSLQLPLLANK